MAVKFLSYIGDAAQSPLALLAYLAAIVSWTVIAWRVQRHKNLLGHLKALPPKDRLQALRAEMGFAHGSAPLNPEQYLRSLIHLFLFLGYIFTAAIVLLVLVIAFIGYSGSVTGTIN